MKKFNHIISLISNIRDKANKLILTELSKNFIYDLAPSHGDILQMLFHTKEITTMQDISKKINRDKSTITSLVNKLVKLGYVEKVKNAEDSRVTIVVLTKKGWELETVFNDISQILLSKVYTNFTLKDKEEAISSLEMIKQNL